MHIKDIPVKGYKTDFAGFELDASKIELHSIHKREIHLPYGNSFPVEGSCIIAQKNKIC